MTPHRAHVGLGANLGDAAGNVRRALEALGEIGVVTRQSSLYRTRPWGKTDQPDFVNAVAQLETSVDPRGLLRELKQIERRLGRVATERWGPRVIDLDLLTYDDLQLDEPDLRLPHPQMRERAFVLVPLAEIEPDYREARDALPAVELQGVEPLGGATISLMAGEAAPFAQRIRRLAAFLATTDAVRIRIERPDDEIEVGRRVRRAQGSADGAPAPGDSSSARVETIKADLVGIFRLSRPAPIEGELLEEDRELGFIEALGIRTPVRSLGAGRIVAIASHDGAPVEYGQPLFLLDRG